MATNTLNHVSDASIYKTFNPAGTAFPSSITNVQAALAAINPQAVNGIPGATQTIIGISRFANQAEVDAGVLTNVAVSPATLKSTVTRPQATETVIGLTRYATDEEAVTGTLRNAAIVPASLKAHTNDLFTRVFARQATEIATGVAKISTSAAALAGTDDTTIMTPKKTLAAINNATSKIPSPSIATTTANGLVRIALPGEVIAGTLDNGIAVSPKGLASLISTTDRRGLVELATGAEVSGGTDTTRAITPATLLSRTGAVNRLGLVKLTSTVGSGDGSTALAYNADVVHLRGGQTINGNLGLTGQITAGNFNLTGSGTIGGNLNVVGNLTRNGRQVVTVDMIGDDVPVGVVMMWAGPLNLVPAKWRQADGWTGYIGNSSYSTLQSIFPSGIPDMRGLFVRGVGVSSHISSQVGTDSKGKPKLGNGCGGGAVGTVQAQMTKKHKHESGWGEHHVRSEARNGCTVRNGYVGSNRTDYDNFKWFTNDGSEVEAANIRDSFGTMNSEGLMGDENRPWNMSVYYIIKVQ